MRSNTRRGAALVLPVAPCALAGLLVAAVLAACSGLARPGSGAGAAILSPGAAPSSSTEVGGGPVTATVVSSTQRGPAAEGTTLRAIASCPAGGVVVGGGASTLLTNGAQPPSSFHFNGTFPLAATTPAWAAVGATGGQLVLGGATTSLVVCAPLPGASVQLVTASAPGPGAVATIARATASCPPGSVLLAGGGYAQSTSSEPSLHFIGSYPSGSGTTPAASGSAAGAWTAVADSGGRGGKGITTNAYALCATGIPWVTQVAVSTVTGPDSPTTAKTATAVCTAGTSLLSGGVRTGLASGGAPQQGMHLTGSFPSSQSGARVAGPGTTPVAWTGRAETGGQNAPHIQTSAFAICAALPGG